MPDLLHLKANGDIALCGYSEDENGKAVIEETVICRASANSFTTISVVFDCKTGYFTAYVNGIEEASVLAPFPVLYYYASFDAQINTRFRLTMFGGAYGQNWAGQEGFPKALVDAGHVTLTESATGNYVYDEDLDSYRKLVVSTDADGKEIVEEGYEEATRYTLSVATGAEAQKAIEEYILENDYFYFDNLTLKYGNTMSN